MHSQKKTAHSTAYHHPSHISVDVQLSGLIKFREYSGVQMTAFDINNPADIYHPMGIQFTWPVTVSLIQGISTVKHGKWSYKSKKGTGHVFYIEHPFTL